MDRLKQRAAERRTALEERHRSVFHPAPWARLAPVLTVIAVVAVAAFAIWRLDFSLARVATGLGHLAKFLSLMFPPATGGQFGTFLAAMGETLAIAFLGTLIAAILAFPFCFLAARNVIPGLVAHLAVRRFLDVIRGVDVLIWALIFISVVGLGPFAGILAIAVADLGVFGKLFSEAVEAADGNPTDGVTAAGGARLHVIRFGLVPQVLPVMLSQVMYQFESNTRSATIIGIVGAGGIGLQLAEQIHLYEWDKVAVLIAMILVAVAIIDSISRLLRLAVIGPVAVPL